MSSNISFVIFTYNEESRISYVIRNFIKYGKVLIMDDGSTDKTKEICDALGADYYIRPKVDKPFIENSEIFDFIKQVVHTDWIYWGYADNLAPKKLLDELEKVSQQEKVKYVNIPLYTYLWGSIDNFSSKAYSPMFFRKDFISFDNNGMHGMGKFLGCEDEILKLLDRPEYALRHYSVYDVNSFIRKHLSYADSEAKSNYINGKKFSFIRMVLAMIRYFFDYYRYGYRNGVSGFITAFSYVCFRFMAHARLYEIENSITTASIEEQYAKSKEELLKEFI